MAAYGSGYYGGGNYSYGISLSGFAASSGSTAAIEGGLIISGEMTVASSSSAAIDAVRVAFMSASVASDATMVIGSNVIVQQGIELTGQSGFGLGGFRVAVGLIELDEASSMSCAARLKWEEEPDTPEVWTVQPDTSEVWTPIT